MWFQWWSIRTTVVCKIMPISGVRSRRKAVTNNSEGKKIYWYGNLGFVKKVSVLWVWKSSDGIKNSNKTKKPGKRNIAWSWKWQRSQTRRSISWISTSWGRTISWTITITWSKVYRVWDGLFNLIILVLICFEVSIHHFCGKFWSRIRYLLFFFVFSFVSINENIMVRFMTLITISGKMGFNFAFGSFVCVKLTPLFGS